jgi:hypothetical protein
MTTSSARKLTTRGGTTSSTAIPSASSANAQSGGRSRRCFYGVAVSGHHLGCHRRIAEARTDGIDTNAPCSIFQSRAFGAPNYSVLGGMIMSTPGSAHKASNGRAFDDSTTSFLAHLVQLELHATPYSTEIDGRHSVKVFSSSVSGSATMF